jgi:hypothetical protein
MLDNEGIKHSDTLLTYGLYHAYVPYFSQRDNTSEPHRSCNKSSCCMAAEYIRPGIFGGSDNVYSLLLEGYGDTTNHEAHTRLLSARGISTEFRYDLSFADLDESLFSRKMPVKLFCI